MSVDLKVEKMVEKRVERRDERKAGSMEDLLIDQRVHSMADLKVVQ